MQKVSLRGRVWQCSKHRCTRDPNWKVRIHIQPNPLRCWQKSHARETIQWGRCYLKEIRPYKHTQMIATRLQPTNSTRLHARLISAGTIVVDVALLCWKIDFSSTCYQDQFLNSSIDQFLHALYALCIYLVSFLSAWNEFWFVPCESIWGSTEKPQSFGFLVRAPSAVTFFSCGGETNI